MQSKKAIAIIAVFLLIAASVIGLIASGIISVKAPDSESGELTSGKVSELAFDSLAPDEEAGVGFELSYEGDDFIICYCECGLFGYDLNKREMTFEIDFVKAYGKKGSVQGSYGTCAVTSSDGKCVVITYTEPDVVYDTYYIDVPTLTYRKGEYEDLANIFVKESAVGYVRSAIEISSAVYVRGDQEWRLFDGYNWR